MWKGEKELVRLQELKEIPALTTIFVWRCPLTLFHIYTPSWPTSLSSPRHIELYSGWS